MKNFKRVLVIPVIALTLFSCGKLELFLSNESETTKANAKIIAFEPNKCGCCWGWTVEMGDKVLKLDDGRVGELVGHKINHPVEVYIEIGEITDNCSKNESGLPDYYELITIETVE